MLAVGCYEAPDYNGTHFKCDSSHACPNGQPCINGMCGGMGSNMPDAPPQQANGVKCGSATCTGTQLCCEDFVNPVSCIAPSATCIGISAACDGKEDCAGQLCCQTGSAAIVCAASCGAGQAICIENADCPSQMPMCCPPTTIYEPWGTCRITCP